MIDHISLNVSDLKKSRDFYVRALSPLGYAVIYDIEDVEKWGMGIKGCSLGERGETRLWLSGDGPVTAVHIAFSTDTKEVVDAFHAAALEAGGRDNGKPGIREQYSPTYYAAFALDPDNNNIELVCRK